MPTPIPSATPTPAPTPTPTPIADYSPNFELVLRNGITVTQEEQATVVAAGANVVINGADPLDGSLVARGGAATTPAVDPRLFDTGSGTLVTSTYLGAVSGADPAAFDWACVRSATNDCESSIVSPLPSCPEGSARSPGSADCIIGNVDRDRRFGPIPGITYATYGITVGSDVGVSGSAPGGRAVTLTLDAGIRIRGLQPTQYFATPQIIVNRGSGIVIDGTATAPVELSSLGIAILGRAPTSKCRTGASRAAGNCENDATFGSGLSGSTTVSYGGNSDGDASGRISYLDIRLPYGIDQRNPALGLFGVGRGTTIGNIRLTGGSGVQLGLLIVGGTANLTYVKVQDIANEAIYIAEGWRGTMQFVLGLQRDVSTFYVAFPRILRIDEENGRDDALPRTRGVIANFTFVQTPSGRAAPVLIGNGVDVSLVNGIIKTPNKCIAMAASTDANGGKSTIRPAGGSAGVPATIDEAGPPRFASDYLACLGR